MILGADCVAKLDAKANPFNPAYSTDHLTALKPDHNILALAWRPPLNLGSEPLLRQVPHYDGMVSAIHGLQSGCPKLTVSIISLSHATHPGLHKNFARRMPSIWGMLRHPAS